MKNTKKKETVHHVTISELSRLWRKDRGTIRRVLHLAEIEPVKHDGKSGFYAIDAAGLALDAHFGRVAIPKPPSTPGEELKLCLLRLGSEVMKLDDLANKNQLAFGWIGNMTDHFSGLVISLRDECIKDGHFKA